MKYIDAHCMIGAHYEPREGKLFTADDVLEEMDFYGIDEAVVYHGMAREHDFHIGNMALLKEIEGKTRLHPCWVLGLHYSGKLPHPQAYIPQALDSGVRLFRLFFGSFISESVHIDLTAYAELFEVLQAHNCPVLVEFEYLFKLTPGEMIQIDNVLQAYPKLPVILGSLCYDRLIIQLIPRLKRYPNLYLMTTGMHAQSDVSGLVNAGFGDRLIYGSGFPWFSGGMTKIALAYEAISEDDHEKITWKNLNGLMKGVQV
jgi:hypothetical protein